MYRNIILTALILSIGCDEVPASDGTIVQEVSETRNQFEVLATECDQYDSTIDLAYSDVIVISMTHYTGSNLREVVEGWRMHEESGLIQISGCEEGVEVVYMYR